MIDIRNVGSLTQLRNIRFFESRFVVQVHLIKMYVLLVYMRGIVKLIRLQYIATSDAPCGGAQYVQKICNEADPN